VQLDLSLVDGANSLDQLCRCDIFQQVSLGAGADGGDHPVLLAKAGQDDDARMGAAFDDPGSGLDAIHPGHDQVQQDHVGLEAASKVYRLDAVRGFSHDFDGQRRRIALQLQKGSQPLSHHGVVIDDQHPDGTSRISGIHRRTENACAHTHLPSTESPGCRVTATRTKYMPPAAW